MRLYKTMIRPTLWYACESWTLNKSDENALNSFERKILRRILGPINDRGTWRLRNNKEVYNNFKEPCISTIIKFKKLEWAGHVTRMENKRIHFVSFSSGATGGVGRNPCCSQIIYIGASSHLSLCRKRGDL